MELEVLPGAFSVCKAADPAAIDLTREFCFVGKTDEELSLLCPTEDAPAAAVAREDGWRGLRIRGTLDFSLVGVLSRLSALLADEGISIFAISTYNTDYIFVKEAQLDAALTALRQAGYPIAP